jgi:hypothetical protein
MIKNISAWKISSLNEYSVQIRLGSNLGGFFISGRRRMPMAEKVDQIRQYLHLMTQTTTIP